MKHDYEQVEADVVDSLSILLQHKMRLLATEQKHHGGGVDAMDDNLTKLTKQVEYLLDMRTSFEIMVSDVVLNNVTSLCNPDA